MGTYKAYTLFPLFFFNDSIQRVLVSLSHITVSLHFGKHFKPNTWIPHFRHILPFTFNDGLRLISMYLHPFSLQREPPFPGQSSTPFPLSLYCHQWYQVTYQVLRNQLHHLSYDVRACVRVCGRAFVRSCVRERAWVHACMYVYNVCIHAFTYVRTYIRTHACMYVCMYVCMYLWTVCTYLRTYRYTYTHVCKRAQ